MSMDCCRSQVGAVVLAVVLVVVDVLMLMSLFDGGWGGGAAWKVIVICWMTPSLF
jgi:hypothetical protein